MIFKRTVVCYCDSIYDANHNAHACTDMGVAESDNSYLVETCMYSLNTTSRIKAQLRSLDIVLHIGDISYALGYSSMVRNHYVYNCFMFIQFLPTPSMGLYGWHFHRKVIFVISACMIISLLQNVEH